MEEKNICKECMQNEYEIQKGNDSDFPVFTIIGGTLGTALSFLTGAFVLLPIALIAGAGTDVVCERCGSNKDIYQVMESEVDEYGKTYSPLDSKQGGEDDFLDTESETSQKLRYRFNQVEKKLVAEKSEVLGNPDAGQSDFDWNITTESTGNYGSEVAGSGSQNFGEGSSGTGNGLTGFNSDMGSMAGSGGGE